MLKFSVYALISCFYTAALPAMDFYPPSPLHVLEKSSNNETLALLRHKIQSGKWEDVCHLVKESMHKHKLSFHDLEKFASTLPENSLTHALEATNSILSLKVKTGLSAAVVLPIAIFAETYLEQEIAKGHYFFKKPSFERNVEYDPECKKLLIHLGTHGVSPIGEGRSKVVYKTVLYDRHAPQMFAHGVTTRDVKAEVYAMRVLRGVPGVISAEALLTHKDPHSKKTVTGIVTPIYNQGSLEAFLQKNGSHLTFNERLKIANDLIIGLASMHEHGFVHRDLGVRNHFVNMNTKGHHRKIVATIADLGRTLPVDEAGGHYVQGNSHYLCPEGFFQSKMKGKHYYASDVFAMGVVFWQLYFNELPAWSLPRYFKQESLAMKERHRRHLSQLKRTRKPYIEYLHKKKAHNSSLGAKDEFLALIIQMTHPRPKARGTATSLKNKFAKLVKKV